VPEEQEPIATASFEWGGWVTLESLLMLPDKRLAVTPYRHRHPGTRGRPPDGEQLAEFLNAPMHARLRLFHESRHCDRLRSSA
jgi:hypothetical protein